VPAARETVGETMVLVEGTAAVESATTPQDSTGPGDVVKIEAVDVALEAGVEI